LPATDWPWVEVVHNHAGADARHLESLVSAGVRGLVVAGTGNGTVHQSLLNALARAQARGVAVRLVSRCAEGRVVGQAAALKATALQIAPDGLQPFKARISLMLDLLD
jgi:L-asparaginase